MSAERCFKASFALEEPGFPSRFALHHVDSILLLFLYTAWVPRPRRFWFAWPTLCECALGFCLRPSPALSHGPLASSPQHLWPTRSSDVVLYCQSQGLCTGRALCPGNSFLPSRLPVEILAPLSRLSGKPSPPSSLTPQRKTRSASAVMLPWVPACVFHSTGCSLASRWCDYLTAVVPVSSARTGLRSRL